jgi:hypothetical protein
VDIVVEVVSVVEGAVELVVVGAVVGGVDVVEPGRVVVVVALVVVVVGRVVVVVAPGRVVVVVVVVVPGLGEPLRGGRPLVVGAGSLVVVLSPGTVVAGTVLSAVVSDAAPVVVLASAAISSADRGSQSLIGSFSKSSPGLMRRASA